MNPPLDTNDATLASPSSVPTLRNGEARPSCVVCRAEIVDNQWFCRLPQNGNGDAHAEGVSILLCSPRCALKHFETLRPHDNGFDSDYDQNEHTFHFLVDGEKPAWL
jgi:hypothetical protein